MARILPAYNLDNISLVRDNIQVISRCYLNYKLYGTSMAAAWDRQCRSMEFEWREQEYNIYCYINMHKYAIVTADLENVFSRYNLCKVRGFLKLHGSMSETTFMKQMNGNNWRSQDKLVICHLMRYSSIYMVFYFIL